MRVSREFRFEAAHRLEDYDGKCEEMHGHSWKIRVTVSAPVGENGLAFDFVELEREVREKVVDHLDHSYLNDMVRPPSAENVAVWAWDRLSHLPLHEVKVWETPECAVVYDGRT